MRLSKAVQIRRNVIRAFESGCVVYYTRGGEWIRAKSSSELLGGTRFLIDSKWTIKTSDGFSVERDESGKASVICNRIRLADMPTDALRAELAIRQDSEIGPNPIRVGFSVDTEEERSASQ